MRELTNSEITYISGGVFDCSLRTYQKDGGLSGGYITCWESETGTTFTFTYEELPDGNMQVTGYTNANGNTSSYTTSSMQQLGSFVLGTAVAATVVGLGGSTAVAGAVGLAAKVGYSALWNAGGRANQIP